MPLILGGVSFTGNVVRAAARAALTLYHQALGPCCYLTTIPAPLRTHRAHLRPVSMLSMTWSRIPTLVLVAIAASVTILPQTRRKTSCTALALPPSKSNPGTSLILQAQVLKTYLLHHNMTNNTWFVLRASQDAAS